MLYIIRFQAQNKLYRIGRGKAMENANGQLARVDLFQVWGKDLLLCFSELTSLNLALSIRERWISFTLLEASITR